MKSLLPFHSLTYLRRLVRELNSESVNGFYYLGKRWNRARLSKGEIEIRLGSSPWYATLSPCASFTDPSGVEICASRQA